MTTSAHRSTSIAIIGTGLMGSPIARRLHRQGHLVTAYNRSPEKLIPLQNDGIATTETALEAILRSDFVLLMLTDAAAIESMILSPETHSQLKGKTIIQMGTIAPSESLTIAQRVQSSGGIYVEAPVLGSIPEAQIGKLLVLVGAEPQDFMIAQPILQDLGEQPILFGGVGTGAAAKLALNQLIGSLTSAFSISLALVQHHQVDVEAFMKVLRQSALYAPTFDKKLQRMVDQNYTNPNFPTKHLLKDMQLTAVTAKSTGIDVQLIEAVIKIAQSALAQGSGDLDYCAIASTIANSVGPSSIRNHPSTIAHSS
jgi:3-hydroxyisobutyrate dehydrogenase